MDHQSLCSVCGEPDPLLTVEGKRYCGLGCLNEELAKTGHVAWLSDFVVEGIAGEQQSAGLTISPIETRDLESERGNGT